VIAARPDRRDIPGVRWGTFCKDRDQARRVWRELRAAGGGVRAGEQALMLEIYNRVLDLPNTDTLF
jgi:hypothetical protein